MTLTATFCSTPSLQHHCGMDLRNRGSSDRVAEMGVEFGNRTAERGLDGGACFGNRKRRHAILQEGQILGKFGADHIRAGGQELADLYVGGAEPLDRAGQPVAAVF